ncbi:MAG: 2-C-methyl-D-erythritol 2,4-cyclodiphosphate synthase [Gammaproteobacteria bacterium]
MRVGQGFDAHRFQAGRRLVLGGVDIPYELGMEAHSDGDVVIHAICDALLGAAAMGDIGKHFPDTDQNIKNIDSRLILRHIVSLLQQRGYRIGNVDATIVAQMPKMAPHIAAMRANLAMDMQIELDAVNVKATTTEKMGFTGRGEGIAAMAVATLLNA